jgi:ribosomal protein S18 acetylase RimI-like enzyme
MIEAAARGDGPAIRGITEGVGVFTAAEVACVDELFADYLEHGAGGDYRFIVYRDGATVLGYGCYGPTALTEGTWDLYWLGVAPAAHGRGVGRALLERVEAETVAHGGYLLLIETSMTPAYAPARRLYEAAGYQREAVIRDFYARGDDLVMYSKHFA